MAVLIKPRFSNTGQPQQNCVVGAISIWNTTAETAYKRWKARMITANKNLVVTSIFYTN